jgi:hypothetical protein
MPRETVVLQVFVASPSDVAEERVSVETVITHLNQVWSKNLGITFELLKWETNVRPTFSSDPQTAINEQIDPNYDVFIGIFWGRFGTRTPRASSGTQEEFERAYARFQQSKTPEIMLYFKDAPIAPSKVDTQQLQQVQDFRTSISAKGGLYSVFEDQAGFESQLSANLSAFAQEFVSKRKPLVPVSKAVQPKPIDYEGTSSDDDDYGYIDYLEIFESRQAEISSALGVITEATTRVGDQIAQRVQETNAATGGAKEARRLIKRSADDMNSYAEILNNQTSAMAASREPAFGALGNALALSVDFNGHEHDLSAYRLSLGMLLEGVSNSKIGMLEMRTTVDGLPRVSKDLNKAKRAVVVALDKFLSEIDNTASTVNSIIAAIDRMGSVE